MLYIIYCNDEPSVSASIRAKWLDTHIEYLMQHKNILLLGGARLAEDGKTRLGSTYPQCSKPRARSSLLRE